MTFLRMVGVSLAAITLSCVNPIGALGADYSHAVRKLEAKGVRPDFIRLLNAKADLKNQERVIRTNVLGFRIKPDYSGHIDDKAIQKCKGFLKKYDPVLTRVESESHVPKEIIAALLWVETRHGKRLGKFLVPSVYFNLAMADQPEMIEKVLEKLREDVPSTDPQYPEFVEKVKAAATRKSDWAVTEILALQEIYTRKLANPFRIKGSYAGAFGIPQFIPSSYLKWAKSGRNNKTINLFNARDAIPSVGSFLSGNGWTGEEGTHKQALYAYNRSEAYGATILKLATLIKPTDTQHRSVAQESAQR